MKHLPLRELGYAIGFIVLLAAIYVGAYYAIVEKRVQYGPASLGRPPDNFWTYPSFKIRQPWIYNLYEPMYVVDRTLRPDFWNSDVGASE